MCIRDRIHSALSLSLAPLLPSPPPAPFHLQSPSPPLLSRARPLICLRISLPEPLKLNPICPFLVLSLAFSSLALSLPSSSPPFSLPPGNLGNVYFALGDMEKAKEMREKVHCTGTL
eukprot:423139-Rhodomonas_salina.1